MSVCYIFQIFILLAQSIFSAPVTKIFSCSFQVYDLDFAIEVVEADIVQEADALIMYTHHLRKERRFVFCTN